jgi:putative zinc finger/helix-turn-helix YgiT family protein
MKGGAGNCIECGGAVSTRILPHYRDLNIGVAVDLVNIVEETTCKKCGEQEISFPDFNGLLAAVAVARVKTPVRLSGEEIRFLRKALEMTAKELAVYLGMREETISRWENNKENISPPAEKLLRVFVAETLGPLAPGISVSEMEILHMPILSIRGHQKQMRIVLGYEKVSHAGNNHSTQDSSKEEHWRELPKAA